MLHPKQKMVGRAFTVQFMPARPDLDAVVTGTPRRRAWPLLNNQYAIDMLQPGDVLVVDLFGKKEGGTMVGDNLFYYIMKTTKTGGLVVDGAIRDLEGIADMMMPAYFRSAHPTRDRECDADGDQCSGPDRQCHRDAGRPGGRRPARASTSSRRHLVKEIVDNADVIHIHDEWTRKKFDEGKYKSSDIYGSPRDPALKKEYDEYLKKRLEEIRKK